MVVYGIDQVFFGFIFELYDMLLVLLIFELYVMDMVVWVVVCQLKCVLEVVVGIGVVMCVLVCVLFVIMEVVVIDLNLLMFDCVVVVGMDWFVIWQQVDVQ